MSMWQVILKSVHTRESYSPKVTNYVIICSIRCE